MKLIYLQWFIVLYIALGENLLRILEKKRKKDIFRRFEDFLSHTEFSLPSFKLVALAWWETSLKFRDTRTQILV